MFMPSDIRSSIRKSLARLSLEQRESNFHHHTYDEDMRQYEYVMRGDLKNAISEGRRMFEGPTTGSLSDDPVKNYQYLFIASITLASRFCIEGGLHPEIAFNLSDLYIRQVDRCRSVQEIFDLHDTMVRDYTVRMQNLKKANIFSRPVHLAMDYIEQHLQQPLTVADIAGAIQLSKSYLSTLFKTETGEAVSDYVRRKRIETAELLLQYTDYSCLDIAEYLCFSSDSHFSHVFRQYTGITPSQFRKENFRKHFDSTEN